MKKFFTLTLALLASFSLWANYAPTADEIIILNNIKTSSSPYSSHAAISWLSSPASSNSKKAGDPNNNGAATSSNVACYSVKGNSGKEILVSIEGCSQIIIYHESHSSRYIELRNGSKTGALIGAGVAATYFTAVDLNANNQYSIFLHGTAGSDDQDLYVYAIKLIKGTTCSDPAEELALNLSKTTDIYAGDVITVGHTGGNGSTVSYTLDGAPFNAASWTATEGEHTFAISQDAAEVESVLTCGGSDEVVLNVVAAEAVEEVSIAGVTSAYVGAELTYTATAANATAFEWYLDEVKQGSDSAKFIYTAVKGSHSIVCKARNQFNVNPYPEWISSDAKVLNVTNPSGTLISFTVNSDADGAASMSGTFASFATAKVALTKGSSQALEVDGVSYTGYKMDKGKYAGVTIPSVSGSFLAGDTISFCVTKASGTAKLYLYNDEKGTNRLDSIEFSNQTGWATFVLNQTTTGVYLYRSNPDVKPYDQNPYVAAVKVIRPKEVKSVTETLSNVKIDGEAISSANLTTLLADESLDIAESYLNAPEVKFYKTIRTTYEDNTHSDKLDSIVVTSTTVAGKWEAQATINEVEYTITMAKTPSFTVTYKLGSRTLGSELVIANGNPAEYEDYQVIDNNGLSTFVGWYNNADLAEEHKVANMSAEVISAAAIYYAKFNIKYASSINIEQWILDNGAGKGSSTKTDALIAEMNSHNYSTNIEWSNTSKEEIELDSLDDGKTSRNEPYLGLKVKKSGKLINFRLKEGDYVKVKFGQVSTTPKVAINGGDYTDMTITDNVYTYNATGEDLVSIYIDVAQKAVIYKQIMINEDIQDVTLPDTPTAIDNTEDGVKAVKFFENGQLFIRRGDKVFDTKGQVVK